MPLWTWLKRLLGIPPTDDEWREMVRSSPGRGPASGGGQPATKPAPAKLPVSLAQYDAGAFAPLSDDEIRQRAKALGGRMMWNAWFGRRDLIPPAADPRTQLIDAALVGHGFLSREELAEIHEAGAEMDLVRPDIALADAAARAAVAQSDAERKARKEQKQAEAAERKRKAAEKVAHRKRTDIVFLGRGVSHGLADRRANVEELARRGLPLLATPSDVAEALSIPIPRLRWLAFHSDAATRIHYVRFNVPKKSGGTRELAAPHKSLKACQQWILENILSRLPAGEAAHGFVPGRSIVTNAQPHVGHEVVVNLDLRDFFPTITFPRVRGALVQLGYSPAAATILALLCTESPRRTMVYASQTLHVATGPRALPQGACTSPALSNLIARRLDARLAGLCRKLGWTYTRYADDLTFSADGEAAAKVGYLLARVRHIAQDEGFAVNEKKTRVQRQSTAQSVTGLVVNERLGIPRRVVRRLRAILHRARREGLSAQNRTGRPHFRHWLQGMLAYVSMVRADQGRRLRSAYESVWLRGD